MDMAATINTTTYLDMKFTNGNYYLVDILEIALMADESGNVYHSYVKINYSVPKQVQLLMGLQIELLKLRIPFRNVRDGHVEFI